MKKKKKKGTIACIMIEFVIFITSRCFFSSVEWDGQKPKAKIVDDWVLKTKNLEPRLIE